MVLLDENKYRLLDGEKIGEDVFKVIKKDAYFGDITETMILTKKDIKLISRFAGV